MSGGGAVPDDWTPHRRDDGERLGWIRPDGGAWTAIDVLGRVVAASVEWLDAEDALERRGLAFLAEPWMLERGAGQPVRVRLVEVTPARIVVKVEDYGDMSRPHEPIVLPWPLPPQLRPPRPGDPDGFTLSR